MSECILGGGKAHALYLFGSIVQYNANELFEPANTSLLKRFLNEGGKHAGRLDAAWIFLIADPKVGVRRA